MIRGPIDAVGLANALAGAKVLAIPSRIESVPLILGDAIQAGCPVVATDCGDMGSVVVRYGLGVVVPPEDPGAMLAGIQRALAGRYPDRKGLEEARRQFSAGGISQTLIRPLG